MVADVFLSALLVCRLCGKMKALQAAERELEQQRKQHHVAMDKLLLQTQSLEQALKTERHVVTEEKWVQDINLFTTDKFNVVVSSSVHKTKKNNAGLRGLRNNEIQL